MFTGLIEEIGEIVEITPVGDSARFRIAGPLVTSDATHGASICVSGVCLTVVAQGTLPDGRGYFEADVMRQSLAVSALGDLAPGSKVNLERAMQAGARLGGHIVQGHVDGTATLLSRTPHEAWQVLRFSLPQELAPLVCAKGSITVAGVSLTVSAVAAPAESTQWFEVSLIPETLTATTLGELATGARVSIETDILARHAARFTAFQLADAPATPEGASTQQGA